MKRIIYKITTSFVLVCALLFTPSCLTDQNVECNLPEETITVQLSFLNSGTRATEPDVENLNERKIQTLDAFFYQGTTLKWKATGINFDAGLNKAVIPITAAKRTLFLNNTTVSYDVYIVANNAADLSTITEEANNLQALKDLVFQTAGLVTNGGSAPQANFVMDGMVSKTINLNNPDLGTVDLRRAASKIRLRVVNIAVPDFTVNGDVKARLVHFADKSALLTGGALPTMATGDWKSTSDKTMQLSGTEYQTAAPFYTYANNWQTDGARETYIELLIPLKNSANNLTSTFKYRVPVTPRGLTGNDAQYMNRLDRNFLYDIAVTVKILGSVDEPPVELTGNYTIKDWTTQEVLIDVKGAHYLVVSERNVTMPNINTYTLNFNSSVANVTMVSNSLKATYTYINNATGQPVTANVAPAQMPTVTVQPNVASGTISISSAIPVNYIPKDIEFKITNGQTGLTETVVIRQLPATYFSTTKSNGSNMHDYLDPPDQNNPYIYAITTLAPAGDIIWGFPPTDSQGQTINSYEVSQMVSPKFEMASQYGRSPKKNYSEAKSQCRTYVEYTVVGEKRGWRLPTEAEIRYIDQLQYIAPQGTIMIGKWYWDAYSANGAYEMTNGDGGSSTSAHVRCIRDIKN